MTKKCIGCGILLQDTNPEELGYTPKLDNDYCMRCFKLKNYGQEILPKQDISNSDIIEKINKEKGLVLFLVDFLQISDLVLNEYRLLKGNKHLVITKKDLFPKNIEEKKFIKRIQDIYNIKEKIYFISVQDKLTSFIEDISKYKTIVVAGYTSSGKSSLINKIMGSHIVESKNESTTLDFIKVGNKDLMMIDSPGFIFNSTVPMLDIKKRINPNVKKVKSTEEISIKDIVINSNVDNNMIFYIDNNISIIKRNKKETHSKRINIPKNSDLVILGLGFINIKNACILETNLDESLYEVRDSLVGANHE